MLPASQTHRRHRTCAFPLPDEDVTWVWNYNVDDNDEDGLNLIEPTILFSKTIQDNFEINPSAKIIIPFDDMMVASEDIGMAFNLGFGLHPKGSIKKFELSKAILRVEYGLYIPVLGVESYPSHITLGVTFKIK